MTSTTKPDAVPVANIVLAALSGQQCSLVRDGFAEQLVIGFGTRRRSEWPLRETMRAPWLLYSRYGKWRVTDGVRQVASDEEQLDEAALQRTRAVLLHQHVLEVKLGSAASRLRLYFDNGAQLEILAAEDSEADEESWSLEAPGGVVVEALTDQLSVTRRSGVDEMVERSESVLIHGIIRDVATQLGLSLFEPPLTGRPAFDAILTAPDGTVLLLQVKSAEPSRGFAIRAVTVKEAAPPTSTDIALPDLTADEMTEHVRRILSAG